MAKRKNIESQIHIETAKWIKANHADVVFISTTREVGGMKTRVDNSKKSSSHKHPDMMILKKTQLFTGLMIELKKPDKEKLIVKYCNLPDSEKRDILEKKHKNITDRQRALLQWRCMKELRLQGFMCTFACSESEAKSIIQVYLEAQDATFELDTKHVAINFSRYAPANGLTRREVSCCHYHRNY